MQKLKSHRSWLWAGFTCAAGAVGVARAADEFTWQGGNGLSWFAAQNWDPVGVPGVGEHLGANATVQKELNGEILLSANATVGTLAIETPLVIWTATVGAGTANVSNLRLQNAVFSVGDLTFNGSNQWNYGTVQGDVGSPAKNTGTLLLLTGGNKELKGKTLTNEGTVEHIGSPLSFINGAEIVNAAQWNFWNAGGLSGGGMFRNTGTLTRHPSDPPGAFALSEVNVPFDNEGQGSAIANGMNTTLRFRGGGNVSGTYNVTDGARIQFWPSSSLHVFEVQSSANFGGAGEVSITGGPFEVMEGATLTSNVHLAGLHFENATVNPTKIDGTIHNQGIMKWTTGALTGGGEIRNTGAFLLTGGTPLQVKLQNESNVIQSANLFVESGIEIANEPGSIWQMDEGHLMAAPGSSNNKLTNKGVLRRGVPPEVGGPGSGIALSVSLPLFLMPGGEVQAYPPSKVQFTGGGQFTGGEFHAKQTESPPHAEIILNGVQGLPAVYKVLAPTENLGFGSEISDGHLIIGPYAWLRVEGTEFTNWGTMRVQGAIISASDGGKLVNHLGRLTMEPNSSIGTGSNPWGLLDNRGNCIIESCTTVYGKIENRHNVVLLGTMTLNGGEILNQSGIWYATASILGSGVFTNAPAGEFLKIDFPNPVSISSSVMFDNQGKATVDTGTLTIPNCAQVVSGVLTGGEWIVNSPGVLNLGQGIIALGGSAKVNIDGGGWNGFTPEQLAKNTNLRLADLGLALSTLFNEGTVELDQGGSVDTQGPVNNTGNVKIAPGGKLNSQGPVNNNKNAGGAGKIDQVNQLGESGIEEPMITAPVLNNAGLLRPGGEIAPGPFNLTGNLVQLPEGVIHIEVGGTTPVWDHDQVRIYNGTAALAGTLAVDVLPGYEPAVGDSFVVLVLPGAATGVSGAFDSVEAPKGMSFSATYQPDRVVLTFDGYEPQCPPGSADLNCDGSVGVADLLILLASWGPCADCNNCPGDVDDDCSVGVSDLLLLLASWG